MKKLIKKILREHKDPRLNQPLEVGDVIELMYMDDPYNPIPPLTRGVVMGFEPTPGEDKILVRWIIDGEKGEFRNMPMIPEADIWRKIVPELKEQTESSTPDEKMDNLGLPSNMAYDFESKKFVPKPRISPQLFVKVVRGLVNTVTKEKAAEIAVSMGHIDGDVFSDTLKLYGINLRSDRFLSEKLFWATFDNWDKFNSDNPPTSYLDLELRPIKKYEVPVTEYVSRSVAIDYTITEYGYSAKEVKELIRNNVDGEYYYYEWEDSRDYREEVGEEETTDTEIGKPKEVSVINESTNKRIIKENPSPEENDIIDDLKELVRTWDACESDMPVACKYKTQVQELIYKYTNLPITEEKQLQEGTLHGLPVYEFDKIDNKIVQNLLKQYSCGDIASMNEEGEEYVHRKLSDTLKLYGRHLTPAYEYYPKQLIQFIVDKGCPSDYTQFMGERLPDINQYAIDMTYTETDVVTKTAEVIIHDTNFESAMCTARDDFWEYEPDVYDTEIIDSDYQGNEEWTRVTVNGTTKWNIQGGSNNDDNYNPMGVDC